MRRMHTDDRTATDPHGFAPVPDAEIPRPRAERPVHDPWDPAHDPDGPDPYRPDPYGDERYPDAEYVPAGRGPFDDHGLHRYPDGAPRYAAEDGRTGRRVDRRTADRRSRRAPTRPSRTGTARTGTAQNRSPRAGTPRDDASHTGHSRAVPVDRVTDDGGLRITAVAIPVAVGSLVAVAIGVWARVQEPTGVAVNLAGFSSGAAVKTWLATLALVLALAQGWTGMALGGRVGSGPTPLVATVHRWSGRLAVLVTVPVAIQCLVALGWSGVSVRTLLHSLLGCVFYGAFVTKMLLLRRPGVPGWVVAVGGGALLAVLTGIWLTSALWFFGTSGLTF